MTTNNKPIKIDNHAGTIAVHSVAMKFPTQFEIDHLFTYKENGIPKTYPIETGRVYTLGDLLSILGKLTAGFFGTTTNSLVLRTIPSDPISDVKFPAPIQTMLGLDKVQTSTQGQHKLQMGTPIKKDDVVFTASMNSKLAIITCDEVDNHDEDGDVLAVLRIDDIEKYQFNNPPSRDFEKNCDRLLHIRVKDEIGNPLPIKQMLFRLSINDECIRKNVPAYTSDSTARR